MFDNVLNAALLSLIAAVGVAAGQALGDASRRADAAQSAMPVVHLQKVVVVGPRRAAPAVAQADMPVVHLPLVEVVGRAVPPSLKLAAAN